MAHKVKDEVLTSRKYRNLNPAIVERMSVVAQVKYKSPKEVEKNVKADLHTVYSAFWHGPADFAKLFKNICQAKDSGDDGAVDNLLKKAIETNSSSGERLVVLDRFMEVVSLLVSRRDPTIVDVGCGLNPLLFIYKKVLPRARFKVYEIDSELVGFLNDMGELFGYDIEAKLVDSVTEGEYLTQDADLFFLLKMFTTLEFQKKGIAREILEKIKCPNILVSYPTTNIGRNKRGKNMEAAYREQFRRIIADTNWDIEEIALFNELFFVVRK